MTEGIWIALIGLVGVLATGLLGVWVAYIKERREARKDRALAEELRGALRFEISLADSQPCVSPSCPRRTLTATTSTATGAGRDGSPTSASPASASTDESDT